MVTQIDHNRAWRFSRSEYVIFINRPVGVEANANFFIETCSTSVKVSNVSFCLLTLFHISFGKNRSLDMELFYGQRGTYRQVSNGRFRGIIADHCVFNSMPTSFWSGIIFAFSLF